MLFKALEELFPTVFAEEQEVEEQPEEVEEEEEEEEEEEPEDIKPQLEEECSESAKCASSKHHLEECAARVANGSNENCVEEFFHLQHCIDACVAPKLFAGLQ
ncbi:Non-heme 11 kDa protein of cytochrome bc1 complex [Basidiobolus meristosporus CBS 931.73]|uniref:Non-heme 11 kDa protein of cytochrome bc1 complex n=1 Tax=Basidiobolus meristosporus CBS 931.73 TaxID=1314790 RepID=A0A1Y1XV85_9FUNG|nr:Non-heme 11 kDa protein of cytochrome bc1 complex [Basidiobolus meristosporus CBS 931.73]|eukprot:ORX89668.1 Non-heme 11 kDa protein of cytochrome bc1 complex [Basidiobolus meristosporus CBS 931.73]